jgi:iron complex transport system ATP-binding protein
MSHPLLQIDNLSLRRAGKDILNRISLSVQSGEYVSIIGPNGAGKSSLLKSIVGIIRDWSGSISILGRPYADYGHKDLAKHIAYVPQTLKLSTEISVFDFVLMGRFAFSGLMGFITEADRQIVKQSLLQVESEQLIERSMLSLSGGERQRIVIAAALAQAPKLLLLDEPTTFLDPRHQIDIQRLLQRCHLECGLAIISVSHDINSALKIADRVIALKNGAIEFESKDRLAIDPVLVDRLYDTNFARIQDPNISEAFFIPKP